MDDGRVSMSTTSYALQNIDEKLFEILVAAYIRRYNPLVSHLIATGVNARGRQIPCPVDNILWVSGSSPQLVAVATTTRERRSLRGKWLDETEGDFPKAAAEFEKWQDVDPQASRILYLATNQMLQSDVKLYRDAVSKGISKNIEVRVVEASALVDFLNFDPDGQYIRDTLLGIEADRLSESLLRTIAERSLEQHRWTFQIRTNTPEIPRVLHGHVLDTFERSGKSLIGIRGPSGTGKSTLLRQIGHDVNERGGVALWVPADEIVASLSPNTLLLNVLRRFYPSLNAHAGDDALDIGRQLPGGLVLLVDDINRIASPHQALAAIHTLQAAFTAGDSTSRSTEALRMVRMLVPLWSGQVSASLNSQQSDTLWEIVELGAFSDSERWALVHSVSENSSPVVRQAIDALNGDPFLCGLTSLAAFPLSGSTRTELVRGIFENAITESITTTRPSTNLQATDDEFETAIDQLVAFMLQTDTPEPPWSDIRRTLGNDSATLLYALAQANQLGWIEKRYSQEVWRWKHTRLRDAIVGRWFARNVLLQVSANDLSQDALMWLAHPGLAEAFAIGLTFVPSRLHKQVLTLLAHHQPLALAEVLRLNLFPSTVSVRHLIASGLKQTMDSFDERIEVFVRDPRHLLLEKLAQTDNELVLEITEGLPNGVYVWAARFRNGDLTAGLDWIQRERRSDFLPAMRFTFLEQAIAAYARVHNHHREHVAELLAQAMPDMAGTTLILASYLAWPELVEPLWNAWSKLSESDQTETLVATAWFLSQCEDYNVQPKLESVFLRSLIFSDERPETEPGSERYQRFVQPLRHARWRPITPMAAEAWALIISRHPELQESMGYLLGGIDHPMTLEAYIRWHVTGGHKWSFWDEGVETIDPLAEASHDSKAPETQAARSHLWKIIRHDPDEHVRRRAWYLWRRAAKRSDLPLLQQIPSDDTLFEDVLKVRVKLRDRTAVNLLIDRMRTVPHRWCGHAPLLSNEPGVFDTLLDNLEEALQADTYDVGYSEWVIRHLPSEQVQWIIREKRELLLQTPRVWPSLWRSNVPEALMLLQTAVAQSREDDLHFFFTRGSWPYPVSQMMLDTFVPVLDRLADRERKNLADLALRHGFRDWIAAHLSEFLHDTNNRQFEWATPEGVMVTLNEIAAAVPNGVQYVHHKTKYFGLDISLSEHPQSMARIDDVLKVWLDHALDRERMITAAMFLARFGSANDLTWWRQMEPESTDKMAHRIWFDTLFHMRRRLWQKLETGDSFD